MKAFLPLLAALSLTACATGPSSVHLNAGKALLAAEGTLDAAVIAADVAVRTGSTTPAQNARIAAVTAPCPPGAVTVSTVPLCPVVGTLTLARQAYAASDATTFPGLTAALLSLAVQIGGLHS